MEEKVRDVLTATVRWKKDLLMDEAQPIVLNVKKCLIQ